MMRMAVFLCINAAVLLLTTTVVMASINWTIAWCCMAPFVWALIGYRREEEQ